ncbi:MAG TPA: universal stress protein [Thermoanaerobaculia bacterium]|nr:universal stress protein [Thermoanaerobaculia bacterium]
MTILCATDFSQPADDAVRVAADIARKRGETLLLWHAVQPQMGDPIGPYAEPMRADAAARLEAGAERIRSTRLTVETSAVVGFPDQELPTTMPADTTLIVAGARGHSRGTHWLIGTVVERLAQVAPVPMLVVRQPAALQSWMEGIGTLNVVVATDLSAVSDFALRRANLLRALGPCNLELLYVEYPPTEYARLGVGPVSVYRSHRVIDDVLTHELTRRADTVNLGGNVSTRIAKTLGEAGAAIAMEAEEADADLIVVGSHQRRALSRVWQGSIAHGVLHSAETNVLVVPFHTADEEIRALETVPLTTIVAATDFSPCGNRAVAWACSMAPRGAHVVLVNVVRRDSEADASSRELDRVKATVSRGDGMRVDTVAMVGKDVAATICATAERVGADAVIVGRHSRSRASQLFLGSVSGEVLARSRRPVLIVPDPATI